MSWHYRIFFVRKNSPPALSCAFFFAFNWVSRIHISKSNLAVVEECSQAYFIEKLFPPFRLILRATAAVAISTWCFSLIFTMCVCLRIRMELFLTAEHLEKYEKNCFQNDNRTSIMLLNFPHDEQVFHQTSSKLNIISTAWAFRWILKYVVNFFWSTELWQRVMKIYRLKLWASWRANTEFNHTLSEILN